MAKSKSFLVLCSMLLLFNVCLGQGRQQQFKSNECQFDQLTALEPNNRIEAEAGLTEVWDSNEQQFQCSGVSVIRHNIERNGLLLPSFTSAPQLIYIVQGKGMLGMMIPGCPESFESMSQQQQQQPWRGEEQQRFEGRERGMRGGSYQDQHQKIRHFRQGDIIALPAGVAYWTYNDGEESVISVILMDTSNHVNQLDQDIPRRFYLAGQPQQEHGQQQFRGGEGRRGQRGGNIFSGFDTRILAESFGVSEETARKLQSEEDDRGNIVRVHEGLQVIRPPRRYEERERRSQHYVTPVLAENGLEETICSARVRENLDDPERADVYTPQAGRLSTLNSYNLPILQLLKLSAEKGVLQRDAIMAPHYNLNAHSIVYGVSGRARIQIVNDQGNQVFNDELREGQIVVVPQNFAVVKQSTGERFEWIAFKTSENAMFQTLAGRTSAIRAMPLQIISNIYQISPEQARRLKYSRLETTLFKSRNPGYEQRRVLDA